MLHSDPDTAALDNLPWNASSWHPSLSTSEAETLPSTQEVFKEPRKLDKGPHRAHLHVKVEKHQLIYIIKAVSPTEHSPTQ